MDKFIGVQEYFTFTKEKSVCELRRREKSGMKKITPAEFSLPPPV